MSSVAFEDCQGAHHRLQDLGGHEVARYLAFRILSGSRSMKLASSLSAASTAASRLFPCGGSVRLPGSCVVPSPLAAGSISSWARFFAPLIWSAGVSTARLSAKGSGNALTTSKHTLIVLAVADKSVSN